MSGDPGEDALGKQVVEGLHLLVAKSALGVVGQAVAGPPLPGPTPVEGGKPRKSFAF